MNAPINHLSHMAILQVDFDIWSGQVKLDDPDIKLGIGGELPPKDLVDLGRKYVIDKKHLKGFHRLNSQARRLCLAHGMSFMGGYAVPLDSIDSLSKELNEIAAEMNSLKAEFISNYDQWAYDWEKEWSMKDADYATAIRSGKLSKAVVEKRIGFEYQIFQVNPVNSTEAGKINSKASGLTDQLLDEVIEESITFFMKNLKGRSSCRSSTKKTLQRIVYKVEGLSFLDRRFLSIAGLLKNMIAAYPLDGKAAVGEAFQRIFSAVLVLSSKDNIQLYVDNDDTVDSTMKLSDDMFDSDSEHGFIESEPKSEPEIYVEDEDEDEDDIDQFFRQYDKTEITEIADSSYF